MPKKEPSTTRQLMRDCHYSLARLPPNTVQDAEPACPAPTPAPNNFFKLREYLVVLQTQLLVPILLGNSQALLLLKLSLQYVDFSARLARPHAHAVILINRCSVHIAHRSLR